MSHKHKSKFSKRQLDLILSLCNSCVSVKELEYEVKR